MKGVDMVTIKPFHHTKVSNELLTTAARETMAIISSFGEEDPVLIRQKTALAGLTSEMDAAFQRIRISDFTVIKLNLDIRRDKLIVATRSTLNSAVSQGILSPEKADAAQKIIVHMDKMDDDVTKLGYREESAQIRGFLASVASLATEQNTTGTTELIAALQATQNEFEAVTTEKTDVETATIEPRNMKDIKKDIVIRLDGLFGHLTLNSLDLPEKYSSTVININKTIDEVMAKAKADSSRSESFEAN